MKKGLLTAPGTYRNRPSLHLLKMSKIPEIEWLQSEEAMRHRRMSWKIKRFSWGMIALTLAAALLGLLGPGPLSHSQAGESSNGYWVEFDRVIRYQAPADIKVYLQKQGEEGKAIAVRVSRDFIEKLEIQQIDPAPANVVLSPEEITYHFETKEEPGEYMVRFTFQPEEWGNFRGNFAMNEHAPVEVKQWVLP
ncbi:MAG: hypothetical protein SFY81_16240 [Verrucomicrobiota bacterium]|nr:hypothetical protein [Verrucomicrobiota bacterium]